MFTQGFSEELGRPDVFHVMRRVGEAAGTSSWPGSWKRHPAKGGSKHESGHERKKGATW
jgi:hypothetical protein